MNVKELYRRMVAGTTYRASWSDCHNRNNHYPITKELRTLSDMPSFLHDKEVFSFEADNGVIVMYISSENFASRPYVDLDQMIREDYGEGKPFEYILKKYKGGIDVDQITYIIKEEMDNIADECDY